jgi:hypothetical protein
MVEPSSLCYLFGVCCEQMNKGVASCHFEGEGFLIEGIVEEEMNIVKVIWPRKIEA